MYVGRRTYCTTAHISHDIPYYVHCNVFNILLAYSENAIVIKYTDFRKLRLFR